MTVRAGHRFRHRANVHRVLTVVAVYGSRALVRTGPDRQPFRITLRHLTGPDYRRMDA